MDLGLADRTCVITGGSRGIGLAVAGRLCEEGARVLLVGRGEDALRDAQASLGAGDRVAWLAVDVTAPDIGERVAGACEERLAPADVLVNNAGGMEIIPIDELTDAEYEAQFERHVLAPLRLMRVLVPAMASRGWGRVVNVASTSGRRPGSNNLAYAVSKAAELSLSRGYAERHAADGVVVNAVNPGPIAAASWLGDGGLGDQLAQRRGTTREAVIEGIASGLPSGRLVDEQDVADAIVFLCSERAGTVVGAAWSVDGGAVPAIF